MKLLTTEKVSIDEIIDVIVKERSQPPSNELKASTRLLLDEAVSYTHLTLPTTPYV